MENQDSKQLRLDKAVKYDLPFRPFLIPFNGPRVFKHALFWMWDISISWVSFDRIMRVKPDLPPDRGLFWFIFVIHILSTAFVFYTYGYLVIPKLMNLLLKLRATGKVLWWNAIFTALATFAVFTFFNILDYYTFTTAYFKFTPPPPYIQRCYTLIVDKGPFGFVTDFFVWSFIWGYNVSYVLLPLCMRMIRAGIEWGFVSIKQKEANEELTERHIQALHDQINPHFLFNVFNTIYSLIEQTNKQAARLLLRLSDLMHYTIYETSKKEMVPLQGEILFINNYIGIEQSRHYDPDCIQFEVTGKPDQYQVPPLLMITYVENAFKHGLHESMQDGWVKVAIDIDEVANMLHLSVKNHVPDSTVVLQSMGRKKRNKRGVGLENARNRLSLLYTPNGFNLDIQQQSTQYNVELSIPLISSTVNEYQEQN